MALVALDGTPLVQIGSIWAPGQIGAFSSTNILQDAANEACIMYGQIVTDDGASHTIDTTGSSSLQWRTGSVTFVNAGTTFKVGLAAMDTGTGPPARAVNVADVITLDVSASFTGGGGGVTANAWQTSVPTAGTKTVANGDFIAFATQMTALGGADLVNTTVMTNGVAPGRPGVTSFTGAAYAASASSPNCLISFSDGHLGWFGNTVIYSTVTTSTWNSGSAPNELGNFLQFPFPVKVYGIYSMFALGGDTDFVLYSDPLGTPVAQKTVSADANAVTAATVRPHVHLFATPYTTTANQPLAVIAKPSTVTNVSMTYRSFNASTHQVTDHAGTNGYAVSRSGGAGAFAAVNTNKDRYPIGLLVGAFDNAVGGAGGGGFFNPHIGLN